MKTRLFLAAIAFLAAFPSVRAADRPAIVPWPQQVEMKDGAFTLKPETKIATDAASRETAELLAERLRKATGYPLPIVDAAAPGTITLTTQAAGNGLGEEGYSLEVAPDSVVIRAHGQAGMFYGTQTLLQLLPPEIFSATPAKADWKIPCLAIADQPRFRWRGLMLDVARHFSTKQEVEKLLDVMALEKMNVFHWHLTDDQGWRIEIKKYPELTRIGAWRDGIGFDLDPKSAPASAYGAGGQYGGFYTQDEIREVVAYAARRHITVVPEIEMPGHSGAALAAYPQYRCASGPGVYNPAEEKTFAFLQDILTEVFDLFPGPYVHLGGDEVDKRVWQNDPACQALMKREGLADPEALQGWFMQRMEKFVEAHGRTAIGWSEALQGGLSGHTLVMDWIGGAAQAAQLGHDVVMTPTAYCYLDYYQANDPAHEPRAIGGLAPLEKVYLFEPVPAGVDPARILGAQGNLWTEFVPNPQHVEYMIYPRLTALAEVTWSAPTSRDFADFSRRLAVEEKRLDLLGIHYRPAAGGL